MFTRVRLADQWVHSGSFGTNARALGGVEFFLSRGLHSRAPLLSFGLSRVVVFTYAHPYIRGSWVHSRAPWGSLGSFEVPRASPGVVGFVELTRARRGGGWVHPRPLVSLSCFLGVAGFTRIRPGGRCVYPGSLGPFACAFSVVGFSRLRWVHSRARAESLGYAEVLGSITSAMGRRCVYPRTLGSHACALGIVVFIWV